MSDAPAVVLGMFETGLAVGRSLGRAGVKVLGLDYKRKVGFHSRYVDPLICPHPLEQEKEFVEFLSEISSSENTRPALFITSDEFLLPVSRNREELERRYLMNLPDHSILECITDKFRQYELASKAGIPVPRSFVSADMDQLREVMDSVPFPAFVKGAEVTSWRKSMGDSVKGFVVRDRKELADTFRKIFERGATALVQELIPGPDTNHFKSSFYISRSGEVLLAFGLRKIRQQPVGFGFGCLVQSYFDPELLSLGETFFRRIGYRGVGSAEFKLDPRDGKLKLIELNPRYWQQNALAEKCGMNFPLTDYLEVTGGHPKPVRGYRCGIKWVNIYSDIDSFREYRRRGELTFRQWIGSLGGERIFSDLGWDDMVPGLHEIVVGNVFRRTRRYARKILKLR